MLDCLLKKKRKWKVQPIQGIEGPNCSFFQEIGMQKMAQIASTMNEHARDVSANFEIRPTVRQRLLVAQSHYEFHWLRRSACSVPKAGRGKAGNGVERILCGVTVQPRRCLALTRRKSG